MRSRIDAVGTTGARVELMIKKMMMIMMIMMMMMMMILMNGREEHKRSVLLVILARLTRGHGVLLVDWHSDGAQPSTSSYFAGKKASLSSLLISGFNGLLERFVNLLVRKNFLIKHGALDVSLFAFILAVLLALSRLAQSRDFHSGIAGTKNVAGIM